MRQVTFKEIGRSPGRYRRPVYDVSIWSCDHLGTISWHQVFGWRFVPGKNVYSLNIEALGKILAFMKTLPIYSSGKTLGTTRTLEQHP